MHTAPDWRCTYNFVNRHASDVASRVSQPTTDSAYAATNSPLPKCQGCATSDSAGKAKYSAAGDMPTPMHCPIGCPLCNICDISIGFSNPRVDRDMACARADDNAKKKRRLIALSSAPNYFTQMIGTSAIVQFVNGV